MAALTISEAARTWGVHRDTVKAWIKAGKVEAVKDNIGVWRIADGQQPPPGVDLRRPEGKRPEAIMGPSQDDPRDDPRAELADTRQRLAVAEREIELLRERLDDERERRQEKVAELREALTQLRADRDQMAELLQAALHRPSWWERVLRAMRGAGDRQAATREAGSG